MQVQNKFNQNTKIIGVIGHPIKHSFSPLMHNISFELSGLNYLYLPFDVPPALLKDSLKGMVALGIKGFNVTIPLKEKVLPLLKDVSEEANIIGAVNTIVNEEGTLKGYNTDVYGVVETLLPFKDELSNSKVSIIGAGGAARSVIYALIRNFNVAQISIINRTEQIAESLKDYFSTKMLFNEIKSFPLVPPDLIEVFRDSKLIVNTTSMGMFPEVDDSATTIKESFMKGQIVFDVIYNPIKTKLLKLAESQGATIVTGLKMFVEQGAKSYELWTGEQMPKEKVMKALESYLTS
ncbi:MAG: shikimate dehydrogenase [Stygiobacter sp.]|jgi:shikimate dehydrogenase|uniref:Shikimate dehydrogenase (NADP(+)) n=1 Tax=Stygiobacter electus TaxID=3032292 RepID=A0AAE3TCB6_9BACT|nr:shikimate dehydrogenase [Stygiobacter electus]MDF1611296.1 shikimate dehydrogenase [Stygiobacter electus]